MGNQEDLYGTQQLLKQGILPAELIYAHQGFLIPCVGSLQQSTRLTLYAANLARGSNGAIYGCSMTILRHLLESDTAWKIAV